MSIAEEEKYMEANEKKSKDRNAIIIIIICVCASVFKHIY